MKRLPPVPFLLAALFLASGLLPAPVQAQWQASGVPVCTAAGDQYNAVILPAGSGATLIFWQDGRGATFRIYGQKLDANGFAQWTAGGVPLSNPNATAQTPVAVGDGAGGAILAWSEGSAGARDIVVQRVNGSGVVQWGTNGIVLCSAANDQEAPVIVSDNRLSVTTTPGAIVAWQDERADGLNADVYVQGVNASGAPRWTANGLAVCTAVGAQTQIAMVTDGGGTLAQAKSPILAWRDTRSSSAGDIYAQRLDLAGAPLWGADGTAVRTTAVGQEGPAAVLSSTGTAIFGWADDPAGSGDIVAERIGVPGPWLPGGRIVSQALGEQRDLAGRSDGANGAIFVWEDTRAAQGRSTESDLYAQRLTADGTALWLPDGVPVCDQPGAQRDPVLIGDGQKGAIVTWQDFRLGLFSSVIFAQRVDSLGVPRWAADGMRVAIAPTGAQATPVLVSDTAGGAIVAWRDSRNGNLDIYANRVFGDGTVVGVGDALPGLAGLHLAPPFPNPAAGEVTLRFHLGATARVEVEVFAADGRRVRRLAAAQSFDAGPASLAWDGRDDRGVAVPAGLYFARVRAGVEAAVGKVLILR